MYNTCNAKTDRKLASKDMHALLYTVNLVF